MKRTGKEDTSEARLLQDVTRSHGERGTDYLCEKCVG